MSAAMARHLNSSDDHGPEDTLDLRIAAIFIILVAGFGGSVLPLVFKCFRNAAHPATLILRAMSSGVILVLAIIHVIPDGLSDLGELQDYPFGALAVVVGILFMICTESAARSYLYKQTKKKFGRDVHGDLDTTRSPSPPAKDDLSELQDLPADVSPSSIAEPHKLAAAGPAPAAGNPDHHSHTCLAVNHAASWANNPEASMLHDQVIAYLMELACIVHSVVVGITLGVDSDTRSQVVVLLIALIFHQGLEGVGLGSTLVRAGFSMWKALIMITSYALTTPIGIAIGIAIADSYDPDSITALAVQGTLNSLSGGLLLYISLVQLIAEDFTRDDLPQLGTGIQIAMHVALAFGAGGMATLAIWA